MTAFAASNAPITAAGTGEKPISYCARKSLMTSRTSKNPIRKNRKAGAVEITSSAILFDTRAAVENMPRGSVAPDCTLVGSTWARSPTYSTGAERNQPREPSARSGIVRASRAEQINSARDLHREQHREHQPADHRYAERLLDLCSRAQSERQGEQSRGGRQRGHQDGAQANFRRRHQRGGGSRAGGDIAFRVIEEEDSVFRGNSGDHDYSHEGRDVKRDAGQHEPGEAARQAQKRRRHASDRRRNPAELPHQHQEHQGNPRNQHHRKLVERL